MALVFVRNSSVSQEASTHVASTDYLNRSQPPLFTQMVWLYLASTNDTSIITRALESIETELAWWSSNRTINITGPSGTSHQISVYNTSNSAPRPEGYIEDYEVAHGPLGSPDLNLGNATINLLYSQLASGAESGEDYSGARWVKEPLLNASDNTPVLR